MLVSLILLSLIVFVNISWKDYEVYNNLPRYFFNLLSTFGAILILLGLAFSCWFIFASENKNRFYLWGGLTLVCVGYLIYRVSFHKIHKKRTDY